MAPWGRRGIYSGVITSEPRLLTVINPFRAHGKVTNFSHTCYTLARPNRPTSLVFNARMRLVRPKATFSPVDPLPEVAS